MTSRTRSDLLPDQYKVNVSIRFIIVSLTSSIFLAFAVGRASRIILLKGSLTPLFASHEVNSIINRSDYCCEDHEARHAKTLPPPRVQSGKKVPHTIYTSKNFDTARSATSSSLLLRRSDIDENEDNTETCDDPLLDRDIHMNSDEEHLPAGQHLLVDIERVDASFLNSEERLAFAMVEVVNQAQLTLLSYHCHSMVPTGVSCVGVLLESHVSFHTWPGQGVITLDLFTCGSNPLLQVVPIIERLFGVPRPGADGPPHTIWAHKLRGFRPEHYDSPLQAYDLGTNLLGVMTTDYKQEVVSVQTQYQRVDIYDVIYTRFNTLKRYKKSLSNDGSYESQNPSFFKPDRLVLLDGVLQSRSKGEEVYHEALVHPAMFTHANPKRVAIIGGGEGATLREVLKHKSVETAIMIEIDEIMVQVSKQYLPTWSDCSDIMDSATCCLDDPRASVHYEDAIGWFLQRYGRDADVQEEPLDVIIMDALDPQDDVEFANALYNHETFIPALYAALADDGVLIVQVGPSPELDDPSDFLSTHKNKAIVINHLEKVGFESIHAYAEASAGLFEVWNFLVATKKRSTRQRWFRNEAEIAVDIRKRILKSKSGRPSLHYFDGATMATYQRPTKRIQTTFCRRDPTPKECTPDFSGYNPRRLNTPLSNFEVRLSNAGENAGRGVFSKVEIPEGNYLALEQSVHSVNVPSSTFQLLLDMSDFFSDTLNITKLDAFVFYLDAYGFYRRYRGANEASVDSSFMTFVNHGCNSTYNVGMRSDVTEFTANLDDMPEEFSLDAHSTVYNPAADRHLPQYIKCTEMNIRSVSAGEEILDNYLFFVSNPLDWSEDLTHLRIQCSGTDYEMLESDVRVYESYANLH